jgi:hypothetical protein
MKYCLQANNYKRDEAQNFQVMSYKFNIVGTCTRRNYA